MRAVMTWFLLHNKIHEDHETSGLGNNMYKVTLFAHLILENNYCFVCSMFESRSVTICVQTVCHVHSSCAQQSCDPSPRRALARRAPQPRYHEKVCFVFPYRARDQILVTRIHSQCATPHICNASSQLMLSAIFAS